jgi:ferredoxin-NADP reductase
MAILLYRNTGKGGTTALVEALPGNALRITLKMARPWTFHPGQHMYLYIPSVGLWTSHPFSVAWSEGQGNAFLDDKGLVTTRQDVLALQSSTTTTTVSLLIRRRKGFTDRLYKRAANTTFGRISLMAFAEGPYGSLHSLDSYGTVLLIAGGIGITHQVPFARHLVAGFANGTVATRRLTLIWTIQSFDHLEWIRPWMKTTVDMPRCEEILRVRIFITRSEEGDEIPGHPQGSVVHMATGRPNIDELIDAEIRQQVGTMGVMVCGNGSLGDDVRRVCRKRQSWSHIDYMEESFTW